MEMIKYNDNSNFANPYIMKCVMIGDHGVGKSTFGNAFIEGVFDPSITSTIGISFFAKTISLSNYNDQKIKIQIWDTAGSEKFRSIVRSYLRGVYLGLIMFDLSDRSTWNHVDEWKKSLDEHRTSELIPQIILVGTKSDKNYYAVSEKEIKSKADEWKCNYYILSSKLDTTLSGIDHMFGKEIGLLHQKLLHHHALGKEMPRGVLSNEKSQNVSLEVHYNSRWCCFE